MSELWDAYDKDFNKIEGKTLVRGGESFPGVYHIVVHVLVKHVDGTYLLMQRCATKTYPLLWDASAAGSVIKGETPLQGAFRELEEETGIKAEKLVELGRSRDDEKQNLYVKYMTVVDIKKDSIRFQEGETCNYAWITVDELKNYELAVGRMLEYIK